MGIFEVMLIFFVLLFLGWPIHICMSIPACVWLIISPDSPGIILAQKMYAMHDSFSLMAIPFFMLAGNMMEETGITDSLMEFANSLVGHIRGGLAHTATLAAMILSGISGSGNSDAAAIGSVMLPTLKKSGYDPGQSVAIISAAGALGPIIPPSIFMVIYCNATSSNVGDLYMAGIIPGVIMGVGFMIVNYFYAKKHNVPVTPFKGFRHIGSTLKTAIWALIMPVIILGGIVTGMFTATEAGVIASVYSVLYGIITRKLTWKAMKKSLSEAVVGSVGPMLLIAASTVFAYMLTVYGTDKIIANFVLTYLNNEYLFYFFLLILGVIMGMFIDSIASALMLMPILMPIVSVMGLDFLHFSIIFSLAFLTCTITPPVGTILFVVSGIDGTPVSLAVKPIIPYVLVMLLVVILVIFFPPIGVWLPSVL